MTKLVYLTGPEANAGCRMWVAHSEKKNLYMLGIKQIKFHFPNCGRIINPYPANVENRVSS